MKSKSIITPSVDVITSIFHTTEYAHLPEEKKKELHERAISDNFTPKPIGLGSDLETWVLAAEYVNSKKGIVARVDPNLFVLQQLMDSRSDNINGVYNALYYFLQKDVKSLNKAITEDFIELDKCFEVGAYKAVIILAGAILEAFLIDWLSEIDGIDYFTTPYTITVKKRNGETFVKKADTLSVYIDRIAEIQAPEWMEQKEEATQIRESRNLVHMKLNLRGDVEINEELCIKIISYLKDIMCTRVAKKEDRLESVIKDMVASNNYSIEESDAKALDAFEKIMNIK